MHAHMITCMYLPLVITTHIPAVAEAAEGGGDLGRVPVEQEASLLVKHIIKHGGISVHVPGDVLTRAAPSNQVTK